MKRIFLTIIFSSIFINLIACFCYREGPLKEIIEYDLKQPYSIVFSGKLVKVHMDSSIYSFPYDHPIIYTFEIIESWKISKHYLKYISVYTSQSSCGSTFEMDSTYLVYGTNGIEGIGGGWIPLVFTNSCTGTKLLSKRKDHLEILGVGNRKTRSEPEKPIDPILNNHSTKSWNTFTWISLILNLFLLIIVIRQFYLKNK